MSGPAESSPSRLVAACLTCSMPVGTAAPRPGRPADAAPRDGAASWCPEHGRITPLWRPTDTSYEAFGQYLETAAGLPTYLPWPISPGWRVSDFAAVAGDGRTLATLACVSGTSPQDGPVDVLLVTEELGTGLGARCAAVPGLDPGPLPDHHAPAARVRVGRRSLPLWLVSPSQTPTGADRSVLIGELGGRWLWVVLKPASALLLLHDDWVLRDVSVDGPTLVDLTFAGPGPGW